MPRFTEEAPRIKRSIREVITLEAETLARTAKQVDGSYIAAVRLLARCRGKVVVTGIGKSGIIAQKVAATLAATGTPALYMHTTEGMHGDLGLIEKRDLVLALGKSGEASELISILPTLRRLKVKIVAITANPDSTLAKNAAVALVTPVEKEACPLNLSPTCSSTAALAVGDALAVALMRLRGFKKEHYAWLHPGGQLGRRLTLRVRDVMRGGKENPVVKVSAGLSETLVEITRKHAGAVNVVDPRNRLIGLVTDFDIRKALAGGRDVRKLSIRELMNPKPAKVFSDQLAVDAVEIMSDRRRPFSVLPVVDRRGISVGMVQIHDIRRLGL